MQRLRQSPLRSTARIAPAKQGLLAAANRFVDRPRVELHRREGDHSDMVPEEGLRADARPPILRAIVRALAPCTFRQIADVRKGVGCDTPLSFDDDRDDTTAFDHERIMILAFGSCDEAESRRVIEGSVPRAAALTAAEDLEAIPLFGVAERKEVTNARRLPARRPTVARAAASAGTPLLGE